MNNKYANTNPCVTPHETLFTLKHRHSDTHIVIYQLDNPVVYIKQDFLLHNALIYAIRVNVHNYDL